MYSSAFSNIFLYTTFIFKNIKNGISEFEISYDIGDSAGYVIYDSESKHVFEFSSQDVWLKGRNLFSFKYAFEALISYE